MNERATEIEVKGAVAWLWLNRPERHNAFDAALVAELTEAFEELGARDGIRAIVLGGRGRSFSAGADAQWMREQGAASPEENIADARRLAQLFHLISTSPLPTIARVHGAAIGGGVGLVSACDIALGATTAIFATSEVRLGLIPATIAPYVIRAIGERQARRLFQTGERIDANTAEHLGLLHETVLPEQLDERIETVLAALLAGAPHAQRAAKELVDSVALQPITADLIEDTVQRIAACRAHPEAAEGLAAFLEKRPPAWVIQP